MDPENCFPDGKNYKRTPAPPPSLAPPHLPDPASSSQSHLCHRPRPLSLIPPLDPVYHAPPLNLAPPPYNLPNLTGLSPLPGPAPSRCPAPWPRLLPLAPPSQCPVHVQSKLSQVRNKLQLCFLTQLLLLWNAEICLGANSAVRKRLADGSRPIPPTAELRLPPPPLFDARKTASVITCFLLSRRRVCSQKLIATAIPPLFYQGPAPVSFNLCAANPSSPHLAQYFQR